MLVLDLPHLGGFLLLLQTPTIFARVSSILHHSHDCSRFWSIHHSFQQYIQIPHRIRYSLFVIFNAGRTTMSKPLLHTYGCLISDTPDQQAKHRSPISPHFLLSSHHDQLLFDSSRNTNTNTARTEPTAPSLSYTAREQLANSDTDQTLGE